jgi:hypothetical protein
MRRPDRRSPKIPARAALIFAALLCAPPAQAQPYVRSDCQPLVSTDRLDPSPLAARWYRRFWTGDCDGLRGCLPGSPNWNDVVAKLTARTGPSERAQVLTQVCRLGALIGQEWTRPRDVRRIDTGDLQRFKSTLDAAGDVPAGLTQVEAKARAKIAAPRRP